MGLSGIFGRVSNAARTVLPGIDPKKKSPDVPTPTVTAPAPTLAGAPPSVTQQASDAHGFAQQFANRIRKRAAAGATSSKPSGSLLAPAGATKSLLGF